MPKAHSAGVKIAVEYVSTEHVRPNETNPFNEEPETFQALLRSIDETGGIVDPIHVAPDPEPTKNPNYKASDPAPWFVIIHGEHRWRAARVREDPEVPVINHPNWDEDRQKFYNLRANFISGKVSEKKLIDLIKSLKGEYPRGALWKLMGFTSKEVLDKFIPEVRKALPDEMRKKLDTALARGQIETIDGLSNTIQAIFNEHGAQLQHGFISFTYQGKPHVMVPMTDGLAEVVARMCEQAVEQNADVRDAIRKKLLA